MLDREACERRVYRLATLLSGDPGVAARVIRGVVDAQPDLRKLDDAHMDRLTVLRTRELRRPAGRRREPPAAGAPDGESAIYFSMLDRLRPQLREAWVLHRVYRLGFREMARATDCSVTATRRHLQHADEIVRGALGDRAGTAGETLLRYSLVLDVPELHRRQQARRRIARRWLVWGGPALAAAALLAGLAWWFGRGG